MTTYASHLRDLYNLDPTFFTLSELDDLRKWALKKADLKMANLVYLIMGERGN